jgi:hypothetical protein
VNCGDHDHSELKGSHAFCETHVTLFNGSSKGGMVVYDDNNDKQTYIPVLQVCLILSLL